MKEKGKPRLSRLTAIITQLQSKRIITATYLAEKHNVSVRTIYRDIRTLENSGIPIVTEEGRSNSLQSLIIYHRFFLHFNLKMNRGEP